MEKSNELTQTHTEKTWHDNNDKKERRRKPKKEWKGTGVVYIYIYIREVTRNRTTERAQTRSRWSTGINRERIEETIKERGKKITDIS